MEQVYDDMRRNIGYIDRTSSYIYYFTYKHGLIGKFDISTRQYIRVKEIPGKPMAPFAGTDYGEADLQYWGAQT